MEMRNVDLHLEPSNIVLADDGYQTAVLGTWWLFFCFQKDFDFKRLGAGYCRYCDRSGYLDLPLGYPEVGLLRRFYGRGSSLFRTPTGARILRTPIARTPTNPHMRCGEGDDYLSRRGGGRSMHNQRGVSSRRVLPHRTRSAVAFEVATWCDLFDSLWRCLSAQPFSLRICLEQSF